MTYDAFANTYTPDPLPPCPLCGAAPLVPAITPATHTECSNRACRFSVPVPHWRKVVTALTSEAATLAEQLQQTREVRDWALLSLRRTQAALRKAADELENEVTWLEKRR